MNKKEIEQKILDLKKQIQELESELRVDAFDPEKYIQDLLSNFNYRRDRKTYPLTLFFGFDIDGKYLFEYIDKTNKFFFSQSFFVVMSKNTGWNNEIIMDFSKQRIESFFGLSNVSVCSAWSTPATERENHFKKVK